MYYEVTSKRVVIDPKGADKEISERFIVDNCDLFGEAEMKNIAGVQWRKRCSCN